MYTGTTGSRKPAARYYAYSNQPIGRSPSRRRSAAARSGQARHLGGRIPGCIGDSLHSQALRQPTHQRQRVSQPRGAMDCPAGLSAKATAVSNNLSKIHLIDHRIAQLDRLSTNRYLWGTFLNTLQLNMLDDIQLTSIKTVEEYTVNPAIPPRTVDGKTVPGTNAFSVRKIVVTLDGKDWKLRPAILREIPAMPLHQRILQPTL